LGVSYPFGLGVGWVDHTSPANKNADFIENIDGAFEYQGRYENRHPYAEMPNALN
jgi:hypothetical protein